ncbi:stage II sporulation protein R [Paenibacillus sp. JX-17]|uniref:Stage II sporulation protein R n=1 Tax=Paenibacillus lacisoli TaxID=3064525 RepID=A0ABT9CEX2_9BACL|nr:stage II sporulation protein R [Paenibacillus sp. JX-17]MDO7906507.1 stage II sporulation protein R [Paenibacillus sp. JX-17]
MNWFTRQTALIMGCIFILIMSWEGQKADAALAKSSIPQESIRLRILANSDAPGDQLVKREIRDAVVRQMDSWVQELDNPQSLEQARALIRTRLPDIQATVGRELAARGIDYSYKVELGKVPFPTKLYGGLVYPAGNYEAVRVTLGQGEGQNWWCVLFPPLCFIDAGSGEAAAQAGAAAPADGEAAVRQADQEPVVRFFLWDLLLDIWSWITGLFT